MLYNPAGMRSECSFNIAHWDWKGVGAEGFSQHKAGSFINWWRASQLVVSPKNWEVNTKHDKTLEKSVASPKMKPGQVVSPGKRFLLNELVLQNCKAWEKSTTSKHQLSQQTKEFIPRNCSTEANLKETFKDCFYNACRIRGKSEKR